MHIFLFEKAYDDLILMRVQVNITKESNNVETCTEKMGLHIQVFIIIIQMQMLCINSACSVIQLWIHNTFKTASSSTNITYAQLGCRQNSSCQSYLLKKIFLFFLPRERGIIKYVLVIWLHEVLLSSYTRKIISYLMKSFK